MAFTSPLLIMQMESASLAYCNWCVTKSTILSLKLDEFDHLCLYFWRENSKLTELNTLLEEAPDALREEVLADVGVDGGEGVVEQVRVGLSIHGPRQVDPRPLTTLNYD